ncbi:MAG: glycosyltransferase [Candidatus Alcyoniella australis]|nr:glycosyltransferase [Candidatus Alcyoniella australis]
MMISVIIPARNEQQVLPGLLSSLAAQTYSNREVIVADDCSDDRTSELAEQAGARVVRLERPGGPAAARNAGAAVAQGELLLFLDADTQAPPDLLERFARAFGVPRPPTALVGRYHHQPLNPGWFPRYKARLTELWFGDRMLCDSFETNLGAIGRETFEALGGFDERFLGADVEDYEFGDRVWQVGPIVMDPGLQVRHHFPGFWRNARNFYSRSRMWVQLRLSGRRRFDRSAATPWDAIASLLSLAVLLWPLGLLLVDPAIWWRIMLLLLIGFLTGNRRLLIHMLRSEGIFFTLAAVPATIVQQSAAACGALVGVLRSLLGPVDSE